MSEDASVPLGDSLAISVLELALLVDASVVIGSIKASTSEVADPCSFDGQELSNRDLLLLAKLFAPQCERDGAVGIID